MILELIITRDCNFSCSYCNVKKSKSTMSLDVVKKSIQFLLTNSKTNTDNEIVFFGGEPTLEFDMIKKIVESLKPLNLITKYVLPTNGSILNQEMYAYCKKNNIQVSLSYDGIKSQSARGEINDFSSKTLYRANITTTEDNCKDLMYNLEQMIDDSFIRVNYSFDKTAEWGPAACSTLAKSLDEFMKWYLVEVRTCIDINLVKMPIETYNKKMFLDDKVTSCGAGSTRFAIDTNGDIYPCTGVLDRKEFIIGNVNESMSVKNINSLNGDKCSSCEYLNYCENYCIASDSLCNPKKELFKVVKNIHEKLKDNTLFKSYISNHSIPYLLDSIAIESTQGCNLNCTMCIREDTIRHIDPIIVDKLVEDIMNSNVSINTVKILGWGEPLLNPNIVNILNKLKVVKKKNIQIQMFTNGTISDPSLWDKILETNCLDCSLFL